MIEKIHRFSNIEMANACFDDCYQQVNTSIVLTAYPNALVVRTSISIKNEQTAFVRKCVCVYFVHAIKTVRKKKPRENFGRFHFVDLKNLLKNVSRRVRVSRGR